MRLPMMDDLIVMPPCLCRWGVLAATVRIPEAFHFKIHTRCGVQI